MMSAMASPAAVPGGGSGGGGGTPSMRAAVLRQHGEPPRFGQHPAPSRRPGQALIRITAAPVNPLDLLCASGTSYFGQPALPYVPGTQGVGTVAEADGIPAGQRVWFSCAAGMAPGDGSMAELCVAPETALLPLPDGVSDDLAAALGLSAVAAWMALSWRGQLQPGEHVLVLGASGNVGQVAVQAARLLGPAGWWPRAATRTAGPGPASSAPTPSPTCPARTSTRSPSSWREAVGDRVDLVLDPVWGVPAEAALRVLSPNGRLVNLGSSAAALAAVSSAPLRSRMLTVLGYTNNALTDEQKTAALAEILAHAADGRITADRETVPLDRAAEGWSRCGQVPHRRAVLTP